MFRQLRLTNFRKHTTLDITFQNGVIALRGANEAGKSAILEAIAYAMFGATALRDSFADCVTWGEKESTLKVVLDFELNKVNYRVTRGKSGAEIRTTEKIEATGQTEVRRYIETLLGADAETCSNLMLASQQSVRGVPPRVPALLSN
jgi:exonuclease SbcC